MKHNTVTIRRRCPEGTVFCRIVCADAGNPHTFLISVGKAGSRVSAQADMMARLLGAAVRAGADVENLIEMTEGIAHVDSNGPEEASSLPDAVAQCLREFAEADRPPRYEGISTEESEDEPEATLAPTS